MWRKILVWVLEFALSALGGDLDAETQKQLDEYNAKKVELERIESDSAVELGRLETEIAQLTTKRQINDQEITRLETETKAQDERIRQINDAKNNKLDALHNLDDDAVLRSQL